MGLGNQFEKRNFTLMQNSKGNFVMTVLDTGDSPLERRISQRLKKLMETGQNRVLWWGSKGIELEFENQYKD
jgi:hypothetical protein